MSEDNDLAESAPHFKTGRISGLPVRRRGRMLPHAAILMAGTLLATSAMAQGVDQAIDSFFASAFGWFVALIFYSVPVGGTQFPLIAGWLMAAAVIFTVYFGLPQLRRFGLAIDLVRGRYSDPNHKEPGETSHF